MFGFHLLSILQEISKSIIEYVGPHVGLIDSMIIFFFLNDKQEMNT